MPQKNHDKSGDKNKNTSTRHSSEEKDMSSHKGQAAQGHHKKSNDQAGRMENKNADKAGNMKKEDREHQHEEMDTDEG